jgi:5,10-methylenetetrahydrofolate reductase
MDIAVAFNPYFPEPKNRKMEIDRLHAKLNTGMVNTVYLQFGSDINHLKEGLIALKNAIATYYTKKNLVEGREDKEIKVIGSIMIPSKVLLARMKFRPW